MNDDYYITGEPWRDLASAIVVRAARDYLLSLKKLEKDPDDEAAKRRKEDCIDFLFSDWFGCLTDLDPKLLLAKLHEHFEESLEVDDIGDE